MQRWQTQAGQDSGRAASDVYVNTELFTDNVPLLGSQKEEQKATITGAVSYGILLAIYALFIALSTWVVLLPSRPLLFSTICSCNAILLAVTGILQNHLVSEQHREQKQGYLKFSRRLDWIVHLPFAIVSFGTAGVLLVAVWQPEEERFGIPPLLLLRVVILLEITFTSLSIALYIRKFRKLHGVQRVPDVINSLYSALTPPIPLGSARYNDGGLAEQQAMLLHYQQENLRYLSEEILRLQETLSKYDHSQDGTTPQVDVVHLLAAREQELRAVTAERDQLLADIRLARSLIAERDANFVRVRMDNDQFVEENRRVRCILDEWSARTAKLEIALEAERLANAELLKGIAVLQAGERMNM